MKSILLYVSKTQRVSHKILLILREIQDLYNQYKKDDIVHQIYVINFNFVLILVYSIKNFQFKT